MSDSAVQKGYEHGLLLRVYGVDTPSGDVLPLEAVFVWVGLSDRATVDRRAAEVALNGRRKDVCEMDLGVLDGQRLIQQERRAFGSRVQRPCGCRDDGREAGEKCYCWASGRGLE